MYLKLVRSLVYKQCFITAMLTLENDFGSISSTRNASMTFPFIGYRAWRSQSHLICFLLIFHFEKQFQELPSKVYFFQGQEPKILETYSKLAMKDAIEYMQRNASTIGNISGAESMSAIFKNYTSTNFSGR